MKVRGIVVKIRKSHCLVLASDGTYHKVSLSKHKDARVGSEIEFVLNNWQRYIKPALLVASILVIALGLNLFQQAAILPAYAYISLDINPSIELEVDSDRKVISAHPLNEDAKNLLSDLNISGQQLYVSVNLILAEALNEGYLKPGQKNYVLSTVTLENESSNNINYESLAGEINSAIQDNGVEVDSVVLSADHKLYEDAKTEGVSAGKLLVYRQAVAEGQSVTLQQVKDNSITNLVDSYKIKILPNDKKIIIKHHVFKNSPDPKNNKTDKDPEKGKPDSRNRHNPKDDEQVSAPPKKNHNGSQGGNNVSQKQNNKEVNGKKEQKNGSKAKENGHTPKKGDSSKNSNDNGNGNDTSHSDRQESDDKRDTQQDKQNPGKKPISPGKAK